MLSLASVAGYAAAPPASAGAAPEAVFHLHGTHGYDVSVDASTGAHSLFASKARRMGVPKARLPKAGTDDVTVSVSRGNAAESSYYVSGAVTARRIRARIGPFGRIYVRFEALRSRTVALPRPCSGSVVV